MFSMKFNKDLYSKVVLIKAAYYFTDRAYIHLDSDAEYYYVEIDPKSDDEDDEKSDKRKLDINTLEKEFNNEILAQSVRHEVYLQTKNIRELLLARAMATSVIDEEPEGELPEDEFSEDEIIKDWFERNE